MTYPGAAADERPQVLGGDEGADAAPFAPDEWGESDNDDDDDDGGAAVPAGRYAIEEDGALLPIMAPASSEAASSGKPSGKGARR